MPDFPIERLVTDGVGALAAWVSDVMATEISRHAWLDHLSALLGGTRSGDEATVTIGSATVNVGVVVDTGPSGHPRLTPTMRVQLGDATARLEAAAELFRIDLVDGSATALPSLGVWGASGTPTSPVLDSVSPLVRADTLRIGFSLDADRRLVFVLAADGVLIGTSTYPTIDLTSADAVMDGAGAAIDDIANELLGHLGDALVSARVLLGLDTPPGHLTVPTVSLTDLVTDPVAAVSGHWQAMVADHTEAVTAVLEILRDTISDSSSSAVAVTGSGSLDDPWVVPLIGSVQLRLHLVDDVLVIAVAATTSVDTLGHRCTVVDTAFAATIVEIDLSAGDASLLPELSASLTARERGARPTRALLVLGEDATIRADHVGMRVGWRAEGGLSWSVSAPNLELIVDDEVIAVPIPQIGVDGSVTLPAEGWDSDRIVDRVPGRTGPGHGR